jgi:hypothetical protein
MFILYFPSVITADASSSSPAPQQMLTATFCSQCTLVSHFRADRGVAGLQVRRQGHNRRSLWQEQRLACFSSHIKQTNTNLLKLNMYIKE